MSKKKTWSKEQNNITKNILEKIDVIAFGFDTSGIDKGCTLNNIDGRFGYVTIHDAFENNWNIYNLETDKLLNSYDSIQDLIKDGWKTSN